MAWIVALATLVLSNGEASSQTLYRTTRVLDEKGNACQSASPCTAIETDEVSVDAGRSRTVLVQCPGDHPNLLGWDARRHEHITVGVVATGTGGLTLVIGNNADATGSATVILGCTEQRIRPTSYLQSVGAVPTNRRAVISNAP
ncbi:hypothetical protein [Paracraurococcus lichenis]|uniref:Uncharacterized protein n=1 Tax=Paracraurococcus lichenis TaxID=3064888 RepID=A0ABT9DZZ4_9PROT|nr:hypothetical protein [Paracraurococcus sp. LOR1-02]MDO9709459.1 hypothetical protein [Paracraurococcus sp. LOR1-02]